MIWTDDGRFITADTTRNAPYLFDHPARELGPFNVRVNAVSPGAVVSEAENRVFADRLQQYNDWIIENQCLKQRIEARDVADLVVFLASERSRMITGQNIQVDGGW